MDWQLSEERGVGELDEKGHQDIDQSNGKVGKMQLTFTSKCPLGVIQPQVTETPLPATKYYLSGREKSSFRPREKATDQMWYVIKVFPRLPRPSLQKRKQR